MSLYHIIERVYQRGGGVSAVHRGASMYIGTYKQFEKQFEKQLQVACHVGAVFTGAQVRNKLMKATIGCRNV